MMRLSSPRANHLTSCRGWIGVASVVVLAWHNTVYAASQSDLDSTQAPHQPEAAALVGEMANALKTLNYEGTFVHVQGAHITSMHILHSSDDNGELERLVSLDGEAREVIRSNSLVTCIWPGSESVVVSKAKPRDLLPKVDSQLSNSQRYSFTFGNPDRVAGLATYVVNVDPLDDFRYGYRFWIDQQTKMLLRSMLLDGPHKPVEQVMFTHIEYPLVIDIARFDVAPNADQISWLEPRKAKANTGLPDIFSNQINKVEFAELPMGYREISETYSPMQQDEAPISHVMLSDGMASVSVYVEYLLPADQHRSAEGMSTMGAMNAYGLSTETAFITAVGEVPAETVKAIAAAVQLVE